MIFFNPDDEFVDWLIKYADNRFIIIAGCGKRVLLKKLKRKNAKVIGCDPYHTETDIETINCFLPLEIEDVSLVKSTEALIVAARPDHSGWVGEIPDYMNEVSELLYMGLEENVEKDLKSLDKTAVINYPSQKTIERVYSIRKQI